MVMTQPKASTGTVELTQQKLGQPCGQCLKNILFTLAQEGQILLPETVLKSKRSGASLKMAGMTRERSQAKCDWP